MKKADQLSLSLEAPGSSPQPSVPSPMKSNIVELERARVQKARKFLIEQLARSGLR